MYTLVKTLLVSVALLSVSFMSLHAQRYDELWKEARQLEKEGLPKSAAEVIEKIIRKAEHDKDEGQRIAAFLYGCVLRQQITPDSFYTDVRKLECMKENAQDVVQRSIYASILGELYIRGARMTRNYSDKTNAHPDSIHEWSFQQFKDASSLNYRLSMADVLSLAKVRSDAYLPFVKKGDDAGYFNDDLLHVMAKRAILSFNGSNVDACNERMKYYNQVLTTYRQMGNRNAELLLMLDSIADFTQSSTIYDDGISESQDLQERERKVLASDTYRALEAMRLRFADLPLVAEVYLRMSALEVTPKLKVEWLEEACSRYPTYSRVAALKNKLEELKQPVFCMQMPGIAYPDDTLVCQVRRRHLNNGGAGLIWYRIPEHVAYDSLSVNISKPGFMDFLKREAMSVHTDSLKWENALPYEELTDTFCLQTPDVGLYVLVADVKGITSKDKRSMHIVTVTRLMPIVMEHPDTAVYCKVVDRMTGVPTKDVFVQLFMAGKQLSSGYTDADGKVLLGDDTGNKKLRGGSLSVLAKIGKDVGHPRTHLYGRYSYYEDQTTEKLERLFTDRSVYRPGQTVYVGGLCTTSTRMDEKVNPYQTVVLTLYDANNRKVTDVTAVSDEMGKISAVFNLPAKGLNGMYRIRSEKGYVSFQVAEYKRPTFKVALDELEKYRQSGDSIYVSGKAENYNGTPLRYARVVMDCRVMMWYKGATDDAPVRDTAYTDAEGRFELPLSMEQAYPYHLPYYKKVEITVTNAVGESQMEQVVLPVGREKISLTLNVPSKWMKTALPTIHPQVTTLVGAPLKKGVKLSYRLFPAKKGARTGECLMTDSLPNAPICLTDIEKMPSGGYYIEVTAQCEYDTMTVGAPFVLFDISDVRPVDDCDIWVNVVQNQLSESNHGHVQVGSNRKDVTLYCQMFCQKRMVSDTLFHFSDSILNFVYPMDKVEGDGAYLIYYFVQDGEVYMQSVTLEKVRPEKKLCMRWTSFRNHLLPGMKETWTLRVSTPDGEPASAQLMATLYDASLEGISPHHWRLDKYNNPSLPYVWPETYHDNHYYRCLYAKMQLATVNPLNYSVFDENMLKWNGNQMGMLGGLMRTHRLTAKSAVETQMDKMAVTNGSVHEAAGNGVVQEETLEENDDISDFQIRENLNETAFFYPVLTTDKKGDVSMTFTLPEVLTTWRFMAIAHTEDMKTATFTDEAVAAKEVMVQLHLPRFVRRDDVAMLSATLYNLTEEILSGKVVIDVIDPETERIVWREKKMVTLDANSDSIAEFMFSTEEMPSLVICRIRLETDGHSDGEQRYMPVLDNDEWMTQTLPFMVDEEGKTQIDLSSLYQKNHELATHRKMTLEYTANPLWYAVQALPIVQELRANDALSLASAYCATMMTQHLLSENPEIKTAIKSWQQSHLDMKSTLERQENLASVLIEETPWVAEAEADKQRMQNLGLLLDENYQRDTQRRSAEALGDLQNTDGSFSWYPGMSGNRYITMRVAQMLAKGGDVKALNQGVDVEQMMCYLAEVVAKQLEEYKALRIENVSAHFPAEEWLDYLYVVSALDGYGLKESAKKDANEVMSCLVDTMHALPLSQKAKMAVVLYRDGMNVEAATMLRSIKEHLVPTSQGVSLQYPSNGSVSAERKMEEHVAVMEAMRLSGEKDQKLMNGLVCWLISQKRMQDWGSSCATLDAIKAMTDVCPPNYTAGMDDDLTVKNGRGRTILSISSSDTEWCGLGYVMASIDEGLNHGLKKLCVKKKDASMAWGALYAQYRLPITEAERLSAGMSVRCEVDSANLEVGSRIVLRFLLSADKDYEFVCLKVGRAACLEPTDAISGYAYSNGLGYYREVKDASTHYYFDALPKGVYVLEMECYVEHPGRYQMGNVKMNCVYAPEFSATAEAKELNVVP